MHAEHRGEQGIAEDQRDMDERRHMAAGAEIWALPISAAAGCNMVKQF
jgi:hypothetical protein